MLLNVVAQEVESRLMLNQKCFIILVIIYYIRSHIQQYDSFFILLYKVICRIPMKLLCSSENLSIFTLA